MTEEGKRRPGRPAKAPEKGKRQNYTFRLHDSAREKLIAAAAAANRTLSEEIEYRVELTLQQDEIVGPIARNIAARSVPGEPVDSAAYEGAKAWARRFGYPEGEPGERPPEPPLPPINLEALVDRAVERTLMRVGVIQTPTLPELDEYRHFLDNWWAYQAKQEPGRRSAREPSFAEWRVMKERQKAEEYYEPPEPKKSKDEPAQDGQPVSGKGRAPAK